jgi:hypothetical protein
MRFHDGSGVMLREFAVLIKRKPVHRYNQTLDVEAIDAAHAAEIVMYEYPKGDIWEIECMDDHYY